MTSRAWLKLASLVVLSLGVFALPYFAPISPSMSQSWLTGYNNHLAVVMFLLGSALFVIATDGGLSSPVVDNTKLPRWSLWAAVATAALLCAARLAYRTAGGGEFGSEAAYALDRQGHLDHGERLYRAFEYIYGPLLIWPGHWAQQVLHVSTLRGYFVNWTLQWLLGTAMLWFVFAKADIPTRFRSAGCMMMLLTMFTAIPSEGVNYTPLRLYCATFLCVGVYVLWKRYRRGYLTALAMVAAIGFGFLVSPEQGMSLAVGLGSYAVFLCWRERGQFPAAAAALVLAGSALAVKLATNSGELATTRQMSAGGYSFPLLPSPANLLVLATYVCALGLLYRALRNRDLRTSAVPLALCGIPLLASAMGRCDVGHLMSATPLFVLGVLAISGHPRLFKGWAASFCVIFLWGAVLTPLRETVHKIRYAHREQAVATVAQDAQRLHAVHLRSGNEAPFAPLMVPLMATGEAKWNAQSGHFFGMWNVISSETIAAKAEEIEHRRAPYLILPDNQGPVKVAFWSYDTEVDLLHELEMSPWVPKVRHEVISTTPIEDAIHRLYTPTDELEDGWRVWKLR